MFQLEDTKVKQLEARIRELDRILDYEKKHNIEAQKQIYKRDRRIKELTLEAEEYKQKFKDVSVSVEDLENSLRIYKRKLEDSQDICTQNYHKLRKAHQKYADETAKTEQYEERCRRGRADKQQTSVFYQV